jgi:hypothetical protein
MKGREAIHIVDLYKTFHACRRPEVRAVNGEFNKITCIMYIHLRNCFLFSHTYNMRKYFDGAKGLS